MGLTFVAIGDSLTAGYGDPVPGEPLLSWTDHLARDLRKDGAVGAYTNLGRVGTTTADLLRGQVPSALKAYPGLVSVTTGANDALFPGWTAGVFRRRLEHVVRRLQAEGALVATATYPESRRVSSLNAPWDRSVWDPVLARLAEVNAAVRTVSEEVGAILVDFAASDVVPMRGISDDLLHPNASGYRTMGAFAYGVLRDTVSE